MAAKIEWTKHLMIVSTSVCALFFAAITNG